MRRLVPLLAVCALAACGGDDEPRTVTEVRTETVTQTAPPAAAGDCGIAGSYRVEIVAGAPTCEQAKEAVAGYDPEGPKVQEVGAYTCEGGEAAVRPLIFTCVAGDNEVTASLPGE